MEDEVEVLWQLHLDPHTLKEVSALPDRCFEVANDHHRATFRCAFQAETVEWLEHISVLIEWTKEQCSANKWSFVYLNIYDLAQDWRVGMFNRVSQDVLQLGGMFHAGVEVYGREYMFGCSADSEDEQDIYVIAYPEETGVSACEPRSCDRHTFRQAESLGLTVLSEVEVLDALCILARDWPARSYRLLERNCIHFCRELCETLRVMPPPDWVDSLAKSAAERHVLQPEGKEAMAEADDKEVTCFWRHKCVLQAQSFVAGFVECIVCETCVRELDRGEPHWHCDKCDFDMCVPCANEPHVISPFTAPDSELPSRVQVTV